MATAVKETVAFDWGALDKEPAFSYIGEVITADVGMVARERLDGWDTPPAEDVEIRELRMTIRPLNHIVILEGDKDSYEISMTLDKADGTPKNARSGSGRFKKSIKELGFDNPLETVGSVFRVQRGQESFGKDFEAYVTRFVEHFPEGYTHDGPLPTVDLRKADAVDAPGNAPASEATNASVEMTEILVASLIGKEATVETAFAAAGALPKAPGRTQFLDAALDGRLLDMLVEQGHITVVEDGFIKAA